MFHGGGGRGQLISVTSQNMYSFACFMRGGGGGGGGGGWQMGDLNSVISVKPKHLIIIIIIRNTYIALNPTRLAQSSLQFKTRMDIRINT